MNSDQGLFSISSIMGGVWAALLIIAMCQINSCQTTWKIERHLEKIAEKTNVSTNAR